MRAFTTADALLFCSQGGDHLAKPKYEKWLTEEGLTLIEGWARDGLIDEQIAKNMGISTATLYKYKNNHQEILEALKKGKEVIDMMVENALLKNALEGETTAAIFWLKNRKPNEWRDTKNIEAKQEITQMNNPLEKFSKAELREVLRGDK